MCARLVDPGAADDLAQDVFVRALRSIDGYRGESPPMAWLATITRRVCADEIARRRRERERQQRLVALRRPDDPDPTDAVDLADLLARLPADQRQAFVLTAVFGLSYLDTAAIMGSPVGTVRSRVSRARRRLLEELRPTTDRPTAVPVPQPGATPVPSAGPVVGELVRAC